MVKRHYQGITLALFGVALGGCPIDDAQVGTGGGSSSSSSGMGGSGGMATSSSSSSGGSGGSGGVGGSGGGSGGSGGIGGAGGASSSSGSGGSGGSGGSVGCPVEPGLPGSCDAPGCPACPTLVMFATGMQGGITKRFQSKDNWTMEAVVDEKSDDPPAFAIIPGQKMGVALLRSSENAMKDRLRAAPWTEAGGFAPLANVGPNMTTRSAPSVAASSAAIHVVYQDVNNFRYWYAAYPGAGGFSPANEEVKVGADLYSVGNAGAAITVLGMDPVITNDGFGGPDLYTQIRAGGVWQAATQHVVGFPVDDSVPAIAAPSSAQGPELVVVYPRDMDKQLFFLARKGGMWSMSTEITGAKSIDSALLALPSGEVLLAYREVATSALRWSRFNGTTWTASVDLGVMAKSKPALARGAGDAEAELVYVDMTGKAQHMRLQNGMFTAPVAIGGTGLVGAAIATNL